ncbi:helix-turn-helix domain-containing protein [Microbacterium sp. A93]|uniref:helix-turn-helix domain-containing protein n=1 Tax=Microbacterium sp. A93 TaxID=3450716 RepID=UPI003F42128B
MTEKNGLGMFLRASRARITPEQAGLTLYGDNRRVQGLRREELAVLAGVSSSYYTRLEQGQANGASAQVLNSIAAALLLTDDERAHLHELASHHDGTLRTRAIRGVETADRALLELIDSMPDVPAMVLGRRSEVLAWNRLGHALLTPHLSYEAPQHPRSRPVLAELVFLDPALRTLYVDWPAKSRAVVGDLRLAVGTYPDDTALASLIGMLSMKSPEFARLWADNRVQARNTAVYELRHPLVGSLTVTKQSLQSPGSHAQLLVTHTAPAGSASREGLALLHHVVPPHAVPGMLSESTAPPAHA